MSKKKDVTKNLAAKRKKICTLRAMLKPGKHQVLFRDQYVGYIHVKAHTVKLLECKSNSQEATLNVQLDAECLKKDALREYQKKYV